MKTAEIQQLRNERNEAAALVQGLQTRYRSHRSATRRMVKVMRYLSTRSQRASDRAAPVAVAEWNKGDDWGTLLARFRAALQTGPMGHGRTEDSSRAA